ncbi:hypothetical protein BGZ65_011143 [Modicella reniformis]|uniref:Uncharacterized protein n=1 Tax=Modicella reniformis TaxID=1440133 RepID=A0A9P6IT84_9FUNG|nr:hypothetical protein BGZ65_011143 [Modicella reniformis]
MNKRKSPTTTGEEQDERHPQKRSIIADTDEDALFRRHLAQDIFSGRLKQVEKCALQYIAQMRLAPTPNPDEFIAHIKGTHPRTKSSVIAWVWGQLREYFNGAEDSDYSPIEALTGVPDAFVGEPWTLPSGASLDNILAPHIRTFTKESTLHSFVIEDLAGLLRLVTEDSDKAELQMVVVQREREQLRELSKIEESYLDLFDKKPDEVVWWTSPHL